MKKKEWKKKYLPPLRFEPGSAGMKGQSSSTELRNELESKPKKNKVLK